MLHLESHDDAGMQRRKPGELLCASVLELAQHTSCVDEGGNDQRNRAAALNDKRRVKRSTWLTSSWSLTVPTCGCQTSLRGVFRTWYRLAYTSSMHWICDGILKSASSSVEG
jgi:hypothetical protein